MMTGFDLFNPGNIRTGVPAFQGEWIPSKNPEFRQFKTMYYGIRAMGVILLVYFHDYELNTVREWITRWAPPADNNPTNAYIDNVCEDCGLDADDPIDPTNPDTLMAVIRGMIHQEQGSLGDISSSDINSAVIDAINSV